MRGPRYLGDTDINPSEISAELKKKFHEALKGKLAIPNCRDCPQSRGFVQVIEFLIPIITDANERIDRASQTMEKFIDLFEQLEESLMKARMLGDDGL